MKAGISPVIPFPPVDNIVKYYLEIIKDLAEELGLDHIFVHAIFKLTYRSNVQNKTSQCQLLVETVGRSIKVK